MIFSIILSSVAHPINASILDKFFGALFAFSVLLIFYVKKMMGAGDVKFATVLGAWIGWELLLYTWALSCAFAVIHGLFARSDFKYFVASWIRIDVNSEIKGRRFIPYVTYLSVATIIVLMNR